jgi:hypothetical protein
VSGQSAVASKDKDLNLFRTDKTGCCHRRDGYPGLGRGSQRLIGEGIQPKSVAAFSSGGKSRTEGFVGLRIRVRDPGTNSVINVAVVESELMTEGGEKGVDFMNAILNSGKGRGRRGPHCGTLNLVPASVAKSTIAMAHYNFKCIDDSSVIVAIGLAGKES